MLDQLSKTLLTMGDFSSAAGQPNPQLLMAQQAAAQLPPPASGWFAALTGKSQALVASGTKGALDDQFQQAVAKDCAEFTRGRYPFSPSSNNDIPLQNFGEMFGYGGRFDSFYKQTLEQADRCQRPQLAMENRPRRGQRFGRHAGADAGGRLDQADVLPQRQPCPRSISPCSRRYSIRAIGKLVIDVDGQKYEYQPGGPMNVTMKWPGPHRGACRYPPMTPRAPC